MSQRFSSGAQERRDAGGDRQPMRADLSATLRRLGQGLDRYAVPDPQDLSGRHLSARAHAGHTRSRRISGKLAPSGSRRRVRR
jgi:hypothetical protein